MRGRSLSGMTWCAPSSLGTAGSSKSRSTIRPQALSQESRLRWFSANRPRIAHWSEASSRRSRKSTPQTALGVRAHVRGAPTARHLKNSFSSETPVSDGERIYVYFGNVGVFALDLEGDLLWSKPFAPAATRLGWGTAASPVLHDGRLYIVNDNDEQSFIVALDAATGDELWRVNRDEGSNWATPYVWENELRTEIITSGTDKVRSYDLEGNLLWELTGMSSITIPTPFSQFGLLYIASGYIGDQFRPVYAIRPGAAGDITLAAGETNDQHIAWFLRQGAPYNPSPIIYGGYYYTLYDRGFFTAHDARTGEEVYGRQRVRRSGAAFTSSPWAYNGKIFALSEGGATTFPWGGQSAIPIRQALPKAI